MNLTAEGYKALTRVVKEIAAEHAQGRVLSCLEGGYNLAALAASVEGHLRELQEACAVRRRRSGDGSAPSAACASGPRWGSSCSRPPGAIPAITGLGPKLFSGCGRIYPTPP